MMPSQRGKYRIQTVAEMTGVPAATLRAWERRYGIPSPQRSDASYRLFSDEDVRAIRQLEELRASGMAPSEAAGVVQREHDAIHTRIETDPYGRGRELIISAIEKVDPPALERAVRSVMFLGSASTVFQEVIGPTMRVVGDYWHDGTFSIAQEHLATEAMLGVTRDMLRLIEPPPTAPPALLACFADEDHGLPLYGVAFALAQWGFRPVVLGARTPPCAVRHAVQSMQPALVCLSASIVPGPDRARELIDAYAKATQSVPWIVGGSASEDLRGIVEASGGIVVGTQPLDQLESLVDEVTQLGAARRARKG